MLCFHVGACRVRVHFSCLALLTACCIFAGAEGCGACFAAVILHELAHLCVMAWLGAPASRVDLSALGCRVVLDGKRPLPDFSHAVIALAGPAMNWLSFAGAAWLGLDGAFAQASLALALAHSLPIEPLDGGLALRYLLRSRLGAGKAEKISRAVSTVFLIPLAVLGFLVLLQTRYNYSLLALSVYIMLYLVLKWDYTEP